MSLYCHFFTFPIQYLRCQKDGNLLKENHLFRQMEKTVKFIDNLLRRSSAVEQVTVRTLWYTLKCMPDKRTYADRAEYIKKAVAKRRRTMRQRAVEYKGGKCSNCGYSKCSEALEFHHHDGRKDFGISQDGLTRSWERIEKELKKCILICANCHREEHVKLRSLAEKSVSEE